MKTILMACFGIGASCAAIATPEVKRDVVIPLLQTERVNVQVSQVVGGLEHPWALEFLPDGRLLITERPGRLWLLDGDVLTRISGVPEVRIGGQGGLLDVIAHPAFSENQLIYLSYAATYSDGFGTRIARARLENDQLNDLRVIFEMSPPGSGPVHFGSRFAFDAEGYFFVSLGERGDRTKSQQMNTHHGKVIRLHDDGRVPDDNPFVGKPDHHPEIYSYGHRNPQGLVFDAKHNRMWLHEHGPRGGDALHILSRAKNYGWPLATYGREYYGPSIGTTPSARDDIQDPVIHWTPSIAPCGMAIVRGGPISPWEGNLLVGALAQQHIRRIELDGEKVVHQEVLLKDRLGRIRDVIQGIDGHVWFITDDPNGGVYRIEALP